LTPATVCLAVPLYEKLELLKENIKAVIAGIGTGVITSLLSVAVMAIFFNLSHEEYVTFLPKSITTAIDMKNLAYKFTHNVTNNTSYDNNRNCKIHIAAQFIRNTHTNGCCNRFR